MAEQSIGALWQKSGKKGIWFSGNIESDGKKTQFVAFPNDYKKEDKHPDYKIFLKKEAERTNNPAPEQGDSDLPF